MTFLETPGALDTPGVYISSEASTKANTTDTIEKIATVLPYAWIILAVVYPASVVAPFNQFKNSTFCHHLPPASDNGQQG